ncbi:hypothetical protein [Microlunatus ginsengisoli]|uniref:Ricin B lectin domain-containing protein n=1 Tax=Microlunatus ginsengisoli TaxID=363863 RepID=A0ABP6ZIX3_9ACTN
MTSTAPIGRTRTQHLAARGAGIAFVLGLTLVLGTVSPASSQPPAGPPANLKAITAMDSRRSEIRHEADPGSTSGKAKVWTNVKALAAAASVGTPTQNMGNPADKTVLQSDKVSIAATTDTADGTSSTNVTTQQATALNEAMSAVDTTKTTAAEPEGGRALIDHQYPSHGGRFVNGKADSTLAFRESLAGSDGLWQLGTTNQTAEQYGMGSPAGAPAVGTTYVITQGQTAITNTSTAGNAALGASPASTAVGSAPNDSQQWAVVDAGNGLVQLVSRADGLCLTHQGPDSQYTATIDACSSDASRQWLVLDDGGLLILPPTGRVQVASALGSASGSGNPGKLVPTSQAGFPQTWQFRPIDEPGGSVPTWSVPRTGGDTAGNISAPYDMSVGDLDGVVSTDGLYHDEAVVAYTDSDDRWALRVVDYNANTSHLLVTAPDPSIDFSKNGWMEGSTWYPGSVFAQIGDFDGDGRNEILAGYQDSGGQYRLSFWRYTAGDDGSRSLTLAVNKDDCAQCDGIPFDGIGDAPTLVAGYNTVAVGDFDGDGATDLAVAYATSAKGNLDSTEQVPNLGIVTFTGALTIRSVEVTPTGIAKNTYLPQAVQGDLTRTGSGLRLQAGVFSMDASQGYGYQRRELAMGWVAGYFKGENNWDDGQGNWDVYGRQPQFQLYAVNDADCPSDSTHQVCTDTTPLSTEQPDLASPFPTSEWTYDLVRHGQPQPDVSPMAMEAGAYGGSGDADPPVWGLWFARWSPNKNLGDSTSRMAYQVATSWVVPWQSATAPDTVVTTDSHATATSTPVSYGVTAYDRFGDSVYLGSPVLFDVDNSRSLDMLAAEPPKHADYLNGAMSKAALSSGYYLTTTSKSGTEWTNSVSNQNTYSNGGSTEDSVKGTLAAGLGPFDEKSSLELKQSFKKAWTGSHTTSTDISGSKSMAITSNAVDDDVIWSSLHDYQVYRYPVLGNLAGGTSCNGSPCNPYYEVTIPGSTTYMSQTGLSDADYSPSWQNNNALSYPVVDANGVLPLPDAGAYSYVDGSGNTQTTDTPLYDEANQLGGATTSVTLSLGSSTGGSTTTTSGRNWDTDTQIGASASLTFGIPKVDGGTLDFSTTNGFEASRTFLNTTVATNKTTSGTEFVLNTAEIPASQGFEVGSAVYYSAAGTPKVVHGVNLTNTAYGTYFTSANTYGTDSDVALNLPGRISIEADSDDNVQVPYLSTSDERQLIRGFQTLQVDDSNDLLPTAGSPFGVNPTSGTRVQFRLPVSNLSLVAMPSATTALFFAVPVNGLNNAVTGTPLTIGTVAVPALGAQASTTITSPIWTAPKVTDAQQYRIFVILDGKGTMPEIHPFAGTVCAGDVLDPDDPADALYDLTSTDPTAPDPTGCGQNNQGYGLLTVNPVALSGEVGSPDKPADVTLDGAGLLDGNKAHVKLGTSSPVPVVPLNANLRGLVYTKADRHSADNQPVIVYDGKPADGKIIYTGRMHGVSADSGGVMPFTWKPTEPGLHELHTVILGSQTAGQDDEQIFRVWVDSKPLVKPFAVTASVDQPAIEAGGSATISGKVGPALDKAEDRDVELQVRRGDGWAPVLEKNTAADGSYSFTVPEPTAGTYVYRVKKNAAGRRSAAYSPELTVTVLKGFVVTAKVGPPAIDLGQATRISGTVVPVQASAADRTVQLQVRSGSTWSRVADGSTTATGTYAFSVRPRAQGSYAYRVLKLGTGQLKAASSPTVTVEVTQQFTVTAKAAPTKITIGRKATISGTVTPRLASAVDRGVQLELKTGSSWKKLSTEHTSAGGTYSFTVKPTRKGNYSYRVVKTAAAGKRAAASPIVKITVRPR